MGLIVVGMMESQEVQKSGSAIVSKIPVLLQTKRIQIQGWTLRIPVSLPIFGLMLTAFTARGLSEIA